MRRMPVSVMVPKPEHRPVGAPFSGDVMDDPGRGPSVAACATGRSHFRKVSGEIPDSHSIRSHYLLLFLSDSES